MTALGCSTDPASLRCHFGEEYRVATGTAVFDDVRLLAQGDDVLAFWSSADGLWRRRLSRVGAPRGPSERLGERCDGGMDAVVRNGGVLVACLRRALRDQEGFAIYFEVREGIARRLLLGPAGRDAEGIAIAALEDRAVVVWQDGMVGTWAVWKADVPFEGTPQSAQLSSPQFAATSPSLVSDETRTLVAWAEVWLDAGFPHGQILVARESGVPARVMEVDVLRPSPVLTGNLDAPALFFRDQRRPYRRTQLFAVQLSERLRATDEPRRIGRSDGRAPPTLLPCMDATVVVHPRSWDEDLLIGVHVLDEDFEKRVGEQQIYEWDAHFSHGAALCTEGGLLTIAAERSRGVDRGVSAHALPLRCD
ncbi:MAG: hypothetical protein AAGE52_11575 [Myxococcota bacterium]